MASFLERIIGRIAPASPEPIPAPTVRDNIFSTGMAHDNSTRRRVLATRLQNAMGMTFQRGVESLRPVDAQGNAATDYALDEAMGEMTQTKMVGRGGGFLPIPQLEWYASQGFIGYHMCALLSQNWLIDKICGVPAADAVRNGWEVVMNDGEKLDPQVMQAIRLADKRINLKAKTRTFIKKSRIFGVRHALFIIDGIDYEAPFNADGIRPGSYRGIAQIDPYWIAPVLDATSAANPGSPHFYEPTWYQVNGRKIHKSHFIVTRCGDDVVDMLKPTYFYGGLPIPQKIYNRVYAAERTADEAPMLAMTKRLMTLKTDVTKWLGPDSKAMEGIQEWMEFQNNYSVKIVGSDDEVAQFETSLQGMDETVMTQYQLVCAAGNCPSTKILGTSPKGFNSTGEYEESVYHEELESIQEDAGTPLIERHHQCLWRSVIAPKFGLDPTKGLEIRWNATDSMTAKEQADVNKTKADTAATLVASGAIDGLDVRRNLIADHESGYTGIEEVVPDGPGDRAAAAEEKKALLDGPQAGAESDAQDEAIAAGILYRAGAKILLVKRRDDRTTMPGVWSVPAGKIEAGESPLQAACREFQEEMGRKLNRATYAWGDDRFALFVHEGPEFVPTLDEEHSAFGWFTPAEAPHPMHPGLATQIEAITGETVAASPFEHAMDARWITVHPNGKEEEGQPVLIDDDGTVLGGMGGKFNGKKIGDLKDHGTKEHEGGKHAGKPQEPEKPSEPAKPVERHETTHANNLSITAKTAEEHGAAARAHYAAAGVADDSETKNEHYRQVVKHQDAARAIRNQAATDAKKAKQDQARELRKEARTSWKGRDYSKHTPEQIHEDLSNDFGVSFVNGTHAHRDKKALMRKWSDNPSPENYKAYNDALDISRQHPVARLKGHSSVDITAKGAAPKGQRDIAARVHAAFGHLNEMGFDVKEATKGADVSYVAGGTGKAGGHAIQIDGAGYFAVSHTLNGADVHADQQRIAAHRAESGRPIWTISSRPGISAEESTRTTIIHEFAHALGMQKHVNSPRKLATLLENKFHGDMAASSKWLKENISEYATANIRETDAELAALVTSSHYVKGTLPIEFENHVYDLFKKKDR